MIANPKMEMRTQMYFLWMMMLTTIGMILRDILSLLDCQVTECRDGLEAKEQLLKQESQFDLIFLDIILPGMDSLKLLDLIKSYFFQLKQIRSEKLKKIPVIMIGHETEMDNCVEYLKAGAVDVLTKPLKVKKLQHLLNCVRKTQSED